MTEPNDIIKFIDSPNTVDFIIQKSPTILKYFEQDPDVFLARELTGGFTVAYIDRDHIERILYDLGSVFQGAESRVMGLLDQVSLDSSGITEVLQNDDLNVSGKGVLIGIIDTGIDYTMDIFRNEDGTSKIVGIYDQTVQGIINPNYEIGIEYTQEQINQALASDDPYSIVPEQDVVGHGTFLASIAAGRRIDGFSGAAPDAELIVVKLKKARSFYLEKYCVPEDQENAFSSAAVMGGIEYILQKSQQLGKPAVICLGVGTNFGTHNGLSSFEQYITLVSQLTGICICVATGNESHAAHHFSGKLNHKDEVQQVQFTVGENVGCLFLTVLNNISDVLSVSFISPSGERVDKLIAKSATSFTIHFDPRTTVTVEYYFPAKVIGGQNTDIRIVDPSPGLWTILIHGDIVQVGDYHVYLPITGFVDPSVKFITPDPYFTTTIPATTNGVINCGAYNAITNELYPPTSWGPNRLYMMSPDFVAPGEYVGGMFPNGFGVMSGTSVAAAITAGACALIMQWGIVDKHDVSLSTNQIRATLIRGAEQFPNEDYPNYRWGYGRLNLFLSYEMTKEIE